MRNCVIVCAGCALALLFGAIVSCSRPRPHLASVSAPIPAGEPASSKLGPPTQAKPSRSVPARFPKIAIQTPASRFKEKLLSWDLEMEPQAQMKLIEEFLALLTEENAAQIVQSLTESELNRQPGAAALERWLRFDLMTAAEWLVNRPGIPNSERAALLAKKLLEKENAFETFVARLPEGEWKDKIVETAGFELAGSNPAVAVALANQMKPGEVQSGLWRTAALEWGRTDPAAVMSWIENVSDAGLREQLVASSARGMAFSDPAKAIEWLLSGVRSEELLGETAVYVARVWSGSEPLVAADWISRFPAGALRSESLDTLVTSWTSSNPAEVRTWMAGLRDESLRNEAASIIARVAEAPVNQTETVVESE